MKNDFEILRKILKQYIDNNGYGNLKTDAFSIYEDIWESGKIDYRIAEAALVTFLSDIPMMLMSWESIDENDAFDCIVSNTCINADIAKDLACMYRELFSRRNIDRWNSAEDLVLNEFCNSEWVIELSDTEYWETGRDYLECQLDASLTFTVEDRDKFAGAIKEYFGDKTIASTEAIREQLENIYSRRIKADFEDYCNEDDYYPPVAEDYDSNYVYVIREFCSAYGLKIVAYKCSGETGDYEPKSNMRYLK